LPMAAHASVPARLYAGTSAGAYVSADGGLTWSAAGLGGSPVSSLAADPTTAGALYAGTNTDLFRGVDGQAWQQLAAGIQHPVAAIVALAPSTGQVVVFAGSQNVLRYPPNAPSSSGAGAVLTVIVLLALVGLFYYFTRRSLRMLGTNAPGARSSRGVSGGEAAGPADPTRGSSIEGLPERDGASQSAHNGHDPTRRP
ncbi:MAG: hypothetical protein ACHQ4H_18920, partial [Ktedonobacterales bacterium]